MSEATCGEAWWRIPQQTPRRRLWICSGRTRTSERGRSPPNSWSARYDVVYRADRGLCWRHAGRLQERDQCFTEFLQLLG